MKVNFSNPVGERINALRLDMTSSALKGHWKDFKAASKEHASLLVNNLDLMDNLAGTAPRVTVNLFSRLGLNMLKVWFLELFRSKTPDEKRLIKIGKERRMDEKVNNLLGLR